MNVYSLKYNEIISESIVSRRSSETEHVQNSSINSCAISLGTNKEAEWAMLTIDIANY